MNLREELKSIKYELKEGMTEAINSVWEKIEKRMDAQDGKSEILQSDITLIKLSLAETITYQKQQRKEINSLNEFAEKQKGITNRIYGYAAAVGSIFALVWVLIVTFVVKPLFTDK